VADFSGSERAETRRGPGAAPGLSIGAILASLASAGVNIALVARLSHSRPLTRRVALVTALVVAIGLGGAVLTARLA
jgi:hypothetical protein